MTPLNATDQEPPIGQIEGEEIQLSQGWGTYPLDSVFVRQEQRTVVEVVRRIDGGRYSLNPDFQRDFVWNTEKQSRLIESCLMRLPLPVFYVAEAKDGRVIVVDGLQRLTTFTKFLANEFCLQFSGNTEADENKEENFLKNKYFRELPINLQERIEDTQLIFYIIDHHAEERARLDIFERVNGGEQLTRQQMRNCLYNGQATRWLKEAASLPSFQSVTGNTLDPKKMQDREAVNRFCGFKILGVEKYKGNYDDFLAETLKCMNVMSDQALTDLKHSFDHSMQHNQTLFGRHAFRKSMSDPKRLSIFNIALYDVCSVIFSEISTREVEEKQEAIKKSFSDLLQEKAFLTTISNATGKTYNVIGKFKLAREALQRALS